LNIDEPGITVYGVVEKGSEIRDLRSGDSEQRSGSAFLKNNINGAFLSLGCYTLAIKF
jgi:hypothetical protein